MTPEAQGYIDAVEGKPRSPPVSGCTEYDSGYKKGTAARKKINPLGQQKFKQEKSND